MKAHLFWEKNENRILTMLTLLVNIAFVSLFFDFYYDLNDDVLMKDIMTGVYTGTPDGHNMQTLYVLGAFISFCYRLCGWIPWYGLFLFLCQAVSLYLVGVRFMDFCRKTWSKIGSMLLLSFFLWGVFLSHMTAIQYTVTAAVMASAAIFLFMTTKRGLTVKQFVLCNVPSIVLVILAYQLRTEMLFLVFPLICLAGLFRWLEEKCFFQKENFGKYGITIGLILLGMLLSRLLDFAAYGSEDWQRFLTFFEKRTEVYDYHYEVLTSKEHAEYLESLGLNEAQQELLANYNFGLDESIDEQVLAKIAVYAKENTTGTEFSVERLLEKMKRYVYRTLHNEDAPYNYMVLAGYLCVAVLGIQAALADRERKGRWKFVWELVLLGIFRTILWMYVLLMGRDPVRITHSLYLAEFAVLLGMLCIRRKQVEREWIGYLPYILLAGIFGCYLSHSITTTFGSQSIREEANADCLAIAQYCREHPENFYFEDVYSTVRFSQKIFEDTDNRLTNYDIMGGWMCKSPLYYEKLKQFGMDTMEEALLRQENVYLLMDMGEEGSNTDWVQAYYAGKGISVSIEAVDTICDEYTVFRVAEQE